MLLIEVERPVENSNVAYPTEYFKAQTLMLSNWRQSRAFTVVEAAGNGSTNLDQLIATAGKTEIARGAPDSGAIMVAAAHSAVPHTPMEFSNFGTASIAMHGAKMSLP